MNNFTRITALLMLTVCLCSAVACAQSGDSGKLVVTAASEVTETHPEDTRVYPELPDADYEGYSFNMAHWIIDGWTILTDLDAEVLDGEIINDAVYARNRTIEEKYKVNITSEYIEINQIISTCKKAVQAGDNAYDVYFPRTYESTQLVSSGVLLDLNQLGFVDWDKPWWDSQAAAELSIDGKLFMMESDITLMDKGATACIYYNKNVAQNYSVENLYDLVYGNKWTLDKIEELAKGVVSDLNGDGIMNEADSWGIVAYDDWTYIILHGSRGRYASKDENDLPVIAFNNDYTINVAEKIIEMIYDTSYFLHTDNITDKNITPIIMMGTDQYLFYVERIMVTEEFRSIESDFGILPVPKFNETQENYGHSVSIHTSGIMVVPKSAPDTERTGLILEALAAESRYTLIPAYYDIVLKDKYSRDEESVDMLDIIFSSRVYDLGEFYQFGGFNEAFLRLHPNKKTDIVSMFAGKEKLMQTAIDKLIQTVQSIE
ncbi:MAG: extracellular solute-binding protein [Eubacteriales bacterium]